MGAGCACLLVTYMFQTSFKQDISSYIWYEVGNEKDQRPNNGEFEVWQIRPYMHLTRIDPKTLNQYALCAHIVASLTSPWCFWVQSHFKRYDAVRCVLNPWLAAFTFWPPGVPRYDSALRDDIKHTIPSWFPFPHTTWNPWFTDVSLDVIRHCWGMTSKTQTPKLQLDSG